MEINKKVINNLSMLCKEHLNYNEEVDTVLIPFGSFFNNKGFIMVKGGYNSFNVLVQYHGFKSDLKIFNNMYEVIKFIEGF